MLKILAILFLLPLNVLASEDCQVSNEGAVTSVTCNQIQLVKQADPSQGDFRVEFIDGFTLFFHTAMPERIDMAFGQRDEAVVSSEEQKSILKLLNMSGVSHSGIESIVKSLEPGESVENHVLAGGEVPWPVKGNEGNGGDKGKGKK